LRDELVAACEAALGLFERDADVHEQTRVAKLLRAAIVRARSTP